MRSRRGRPVLRRFRRECGRLIHFAYGRHDSGRRVLRRERARARRVSPQPYLLSSSRDRWTFARRSARPLRARDRRLAAIQASRLPKPPRANHPADRNYGARSHCVATPDSSQAVLPQHQELPSAAATSPSAASARRALPSAEGRRAAPGSGQEPDQARPLRGRARASHTIVTCRASSPPEPETGQEFAPRRSRQPRRRQALALRISSPQ